MVVTKTWFLPGDNMRQSSSLPVKAAEGQGLAEPQRDDACLRCWPKAGRAKQTQEEEAYLGFTVSGIQVTAKYSLRLAGRTWGS